MGKTTGSAFCLLWLLLGGAVAAAEGRSYELAGTVMVAGKPPGQLPVQVFLDGAASPFMTSTRAGLDGGFRFRKLLPGMYRLTVMVAGWGHMSETVDIGPSRADSKGRITHVVDFRKEPGSDGGATVTAPQLKLPGKAQKAYDKAEAHLERRDVESAIRELQKAVEIAPQFSAAWNRLGTIAYQSKRYADANQYFTEALRQEPGSYPPKVNLGAAQLALGELDLALRTNQEAVRAKPDDPLAHSQLGQVYFALDRLAEAAESLRKAKALEPGHFSYPQLVLAEIYRRQGDPEAMGRELVEFIELHPDAPATPKLRQLLEELREKGASNEE